MAEYFSDSTLRSGNLRTTTPVLDAWPTYLSRPIFNWLPHYEEITENFIDNVSRDQLGFGDVMAWVQEDHPRKTLDFTVHLYSQEEILALRRFFKLCQGRLNGFWMPSFAGDFKLQAQPDTGKIRIEPCGFTQAWNFNSGTTRSVRPLLRNLAFNNHQQLILRQISDAVVPVDAGYEELTLDTALNLSAQFAGQPLKLSQLLYVRFSEDALSITGITNEVATAQIRVVELPTDYAEAQTGQRAVWCYRFTQQLKPGQTTAPSVPEGTSLFSYLRTEWKLTNYGAGVVDYNPASIDSGTIQRNADFHADSLKITVCTTENGHFLRQYLQPVPPQPITVELRRVLLADVASLAPGELEPLAQPPLFVGTIESVEFAEHGKIEISVEAHSGLSSRPVPGLQISRNCGWQLYGEGCKGAAGDGFLNTEANNTYPLSGPAITIKSLTQNGKRWSVELDYYGTAGRTRSALEISNFFASGAMLNKDTGERVPILTQTPQVTSGIPVNAIITIDHGWDDIAEDQEIQLIPGCNHTWQSCQNKFGATPQLYGGTAQSGNTLNYGGFPGIPAYNPQIQQHPPKTKTSAASKK